VGDPFPRQRQDQHSLAASRQATVARAVVPSVWLGYKTTQKLLRIGNGLRLQLWHLGSQLNLSSLLKKLFKFKSQLGIR